MDVVIMLIIVRFLSEPKFSNKIIPIKAGTFVSVKMNAATRLRLFAKLLSCSLKKKSSFPASLIFN